MKLGLSVVVYLIVCYCIWTRFNPNQSQWWYL